MESTPQGDQESPPTILIVEDEQGLADLYTIWLSDSYTVKTTYGGEEALEVIDESVDIMLLDRRMPDLAGDEVLTRVRKEGFDIPVVVASAVSPNFDLLDLEFDEHLEKPAEQTALQEMIERMVTRATYDPAARELARLMSTKQLLEDTISTTELQSHDGYQQLGDRITALQSEVEEIPDEFAETDGGAGTNSTADTRPTE